MPNVDLPLSELKAYKPELTIEPDFDSFWDTQRTVSSERPLNAMLTRVDYPAKHVEVYEVIYDGIDGTPIYGWYILPAEHVESRPLPIVIGYHGYSVDRGCPSDMLYWTTMGVAALIVDTRGQGGKSPDYAVYPQGAAFGKFTLGILDPNTYYFKYAYMDCVRAVDFACSRPEIDSNRIAVSGGSQGGGLALAVAGIDSRPKLVMSFVPAFCDFRRCVEMFNAGPYQEICEWFKRFDPEHKLENTIYRTLSYFDGMNHASRIKARTHMAAALQDLLVPTSTCFAAYNHLKVEKEIMIYPDHGHGMLPGYTEATMKFVQEYL